MIGIIKFNSKKDGGSYIDKYLHSILNKNSIEAIYFHNGHKNVEEKEVKMNFNYKNPFSSLIGCRKLVKSYNLTTIYTNQFVSLLYFVLLRKLRLIHCKIIAKVDGKTIKLGIKKYLFFIYDFFWNFAKRNSDIIIYETEKAKNNWKGNNIVIYTPAVNFFNVKLHDFNKVENSHYNVLYVGRYSKEKGFDRIVDLAIRFPNIKFTMIGGDKSIYSYMPNIEEIGMIEVEKILPFYCKTNILIVPSRDDSFPSVIREFAWFGKPILATNVGSIMEFLELGMDIKIVDNNCASLCNGLNEIYQKRNITNSNRDAYDKNFNPNDSEVILKYCEVFKKMEKLAHENE